MFKNNVVKLYPYTILNNRIFYVILTTIYYVVLEKYKIDYQFKNWECFY